MTLHRNQGRPKVKAEKCGSLNNSDASAALVRRAIALGSPVAAYGRRVCLTVAPEHVMLFDFPMGNRPVSRIGAVRGAVAACAGPVGPPVWAPRRLTIFNEPLMPS